MLKFKCGCFGPETFLDQATELTAIPISISFKEVFCWRFYVAFWKSGFIILETEHSDNWPLTGHVYKRAPITQEDMYGLVIQQSA